MTISFRCLAITAVCLISTSSFAADWIWSSSKPQHGETAWFRHEFNLEKPGEATLTITADNSYAVYVNGGLVGMQRLTEDWAEPDQYILNRALRSGKNSIAVRSINDEGAAAVMVSLKTKDGDQEVLIETGAHWKARGNLQPKWSALDAHGGGWGNAHSFGEVGRTEPWGTLKPASKPASPIEFQQFRERGTPFELLDGDRVVLLGGTFIERAQRYGLLEAALQTRFPDRKFTVRNLAWSADTVWADSRGIFDTPEVGYAQMVEQIRELQPTVIMLNYGANEAFAGQAGLERFLAGYRQLMDDLSVTGASMIVVSPHPLTKLPKPLPDPARQNERLREYSRALAIMAEERGVAFADLYAATAKSKLGPDHTDDGLHFNEAGYQVMARNLVEAAFGGSASLPSSVKPELREAIVRKNELYFHSWRPQNITYLFLFRKHEQGNNAKEVEAFRPLIDDLEARIASLNKSAEK